MRINRGSVTGAQPDAETLARFAGSPCAWFIYYSSRGANGCPLRSLVPASVWSRLYNLQVSDRSCHVDADKQ